MVAPLRFAASAVLGLGLATACSSSTESTAPGDVDVQTFAAAQCDFLARCQPFALALSFGTKEACTTQVAASITPELSLKGVAISQSQATACEGKQATQACGDTTTPAECRLKGTLVDDASCAIDLQCASGNCYFATAADGTTTACGSCKAYAAENGDCTDANCEPGLTCTSAHKCSKGGAEGAACADAFDCTGNLQCLAGKCAPLLPEGASCKPVDGTAGLCDRNVNLYCKPTTADGTIGSCVKYAFADPGAACGIDRTTFQITTCTASQCVVPTADAITGTCTAPLAAGAACSATSVGCAFGLACTAGVCKAPDLASCNP